MAKFTITLPDSVAEKLDADMADQGAPRSTLIARYIEQHYADAGGSEVDCDAIIEELKIKHAYELEKLAEVHEAEHKKLRQGSADVMQRARDEHEKRVQRIVDEHEAEVQQLRAECEKRAEETRQLEEDVERLESITNKLDSEQKASEASKNTVITGLQHEIELLKQKATNLDSTLQAERSHSLELRNDKEQLQKQLELVTLRLPAPKVGFWARLFGSKKG